MILNQNRIVVADFSVMPWNREETVGVKMPMRDGTLPVLINDFVNVLGWNQRHGADADDLAEAERSEAEH